MGISKDTIICAIVFVTCFIAFYSFIRIGVKKIAGAVTAKPSHFFVISLIIIGILGIGIKNLSFDPDLKAMLPKDFPAQRVLDQISDSLGGVDTVYLSVTAEKGTIWDPHILSAIHEISQTLKNAPYVDRVMSITETKSIKNEADIMEVTKIVPDDMTISSKEDAEKIRERAKSNDVLFKRLINSDETSALIVASVKVSMPVIAPDGKRTYRWCSDQEMCEHLPDKPDKPTLLNVMAKYADPAYKLTLTGFPCFRYEMQKRMERDMRLFIVLGLIVMLAFLYASFRSLRGMLLPLTIVVLSLIASFGFMGWMKEKITLPFLLMGPMLIAIAHNYGTQLIAKYYEDVQESRGPFERDDIKRIAEKGLITLGAPVLISAVTVVIGFVTMLLHPLRGLALLGIFCAFGIAISFILTIIFTPAILSLLKIPPMLINKRHGEKTDRVLESIARFTINRKVELLVFLFFVAIVCFYYIQKVETDSNFLNNFPKSSAIYKDADYISKQFGGYTTLNIFTEAAHPVADDSPEDGPMKNPQILKWMEDFQKYALDQKDEKTNKSLIGDALSLSDFVSYMNRIMKEDPNENRVPDSRNLIAQYLLSYESQSEGDLSTLVDYKYNKGQIILRLPDMSSNRLSVIIAHLKKYITNHPMRDIKITFSGTAEINAEFATLIVEGQIWSLALSLLIIVVCYMVFFRSFAAGILAAVPLFCAIVLVFGIMGAMNIPLDYATATLTGISIGAGTDYTAYFLWRLRERTLLYGNLEDGYASTMTSIGKGIVYNGFSVIVGFFVFFFSNFIPIRFFGFLVSFSILACIVSSLTILPVVIFMVKPKFLMQGEKEKDEGLVIPLSLPVKKPQAEAPNVIRAEGEASFKTKDMAG